MVPRRGRGGVRVVGDGVVRDGPGRVGDRALTWKPEEGVNGVWDTAIYAQSAIDNVVDGEPVRAAIYSQLAVAAAIERLAKAVETIQR